MDRRRVALLLLSFTMSGTAWGQARPDAAGLREVGRIALPGINGRIDHMAADADGGRLYVAALGNDTLEVVDLKQGRRVASLPGLKEPQGVRYLPDVGRVVVAGGGDGVCRFLDPATLKVTATVDGLPDADNVRCDPAARRVYVGYGDGALAAIDASAGRKVGEVKLDGHPESFQLEQGGKRPRTFVNVPDAGHVAVVDRQAGRLIARWPLPKGVGANFPMALDEAHGRLFVACRRPAELLVFDTGTGRVVASVACPGDADDVFYDADRGRVYVTGGEGTVGVVRCAAGDRYEPAGTVPTAPGARTSLLVPALGRLYVAVPHRGDQPAEIRVFEAAK